MSINDNDDEPIDGDSTDSSSTANPGAITPAPMPQDAVIRVLPAAEPDGLLIEADSEDMLSADRRAQAAVVYWLEDDPAWSYAVKNFYGAVGRIRTADLQALIDAAAPVPPEPAQPDIEVEPDTGAGPLSATQPPSEEFVVVPAEAPPGDAVIELSRPANPTGPYIRADTGAVVTPAELAATSYAYYGARADTVIVVKNRLSQRRAPYEIRPVLAQVEAETARRLHGAAGGEFKAHVVDDVRHAIRTGPPTPVGTWATLGAAVRLFPAILDQLNLSADDLNALIKLIHNGGYMAGNFANDRGVYFEITAADFEVQIRGDDARRWAPVGDRDPDELARVTLLTRLLKYRATRAGHAAAR